MYSSASTFPADVKALTVSELTAQIRECLEEGFSSVWVAAEVSKPTRPSSGHVYLTLKDNEAQLKAIIWRSLAARMRFELTHGMQIIARGKIDVYAPQGQYSLIIEELYPKGMGVLELAFQQLKEKLEKRGWFGDARKKRLPLFPRRMVLVTSATGAAIRDMLQIIPRRWPAVEILVYPVPVQGEGAAEQIAAAIRQVNQWSDIDVMVVGRGGGSLEDLWAFNEEVVAEAIFHSRIPVISAVGHQIDFTIADFVADKRAATPSEAAELVVPDQMKILEMLAAGQSRLGVCLRQRQASARQRLESIAQRRLFREPLERVRFLEQELDQRAETLRRAARRFFDRAQERINEQAARLEGLSPLNVLRRGYSLTQKEADGRLLRSSENVKIGERLLTRLSQGRLISRVEEVQGE